MLKFKPFDDITRSLCANSRHHFNALIVWLLNQLLLLNITIIKLLKLKNISSHLLLITWVSHTYRLFTPHTFDNTPVFIMIFEVPTLSLPKTTLSRAKYFHFIYDLHRYQVISWVMSVDFNPTKSTSRYMLWIFMRLKHVSEALFAKSMTTEKSPWFCEYIVTNRTLQMLRNMLLHEDPFGLISS